QRLAGAAARPADGPRHDGRRRDRAAQAEERGRAGGLLRADRGRDLQPGAVGHARGRGARAHEAPLPGLRVSDDTASSVNGALVSRIPVASRMALAIAARPGTAGGSPTPRAPWAPCSDGTWISSTSTTSGIRSAVGME